MTLRTSTLTRPEAETLLLHEDFGYLLRCAFATVYPGGRFQPNWHIDLLVHEMMMVAEGKTLRLLINQPPRSMKSLIASVAFPAWLLGLDPTMHIVVVSYAQELASDLHGQFRMVVDSAWYRRAFPDVVAERDTGSEFRTALGGGRYATSVDGSITGRGADLIIIDDPLNAKDAHSEPARRKVIEFYRGTLLSRLNDKKRGSIVVVMQRLHQEDLSGHLIEAGGWRPVLLPAIATEAGTFDLGHGRIHRRRAGDLLHPEREGKQALDLLKVSMRSMAFSAQYQQQPVPAEGNLIKRTWFRRFEALPSAGLRRILQSWDTAMSVNGAADWSVCTTWLVHKGDYYLIDVVRGRWEYPKLRRTIAALAERHKPHAILVEDAGAGKSVLQDLVNARPPGMIKPIGVKPVGDKRERMAMVSHKIEAGQVYLPKEAPWLSDFELELLAFPHGRHDDQVDSVSQALSYKFSTYTLDGVM